MGYLVGFGGLLEKICVADGAKKYIFTLIIYSVNYPLFQLTDQGRCARTTGDSNTSRTSY
jgi:hypothetical protein